MAAAVEAAEALAVDLPKLRGTDPVTSLDLSGRGLGSASATVIASLIAGNAVLTDLNLGDNDIRDEGAAAMRRYAATRCSPT